MPKLIWAIAALAIAATTSADVPANLRDIDFDRGTLSRQAAAEVALAKLVAPPTIRSELARCTPLATDWRIVPILAFDLHRDPTTLTVVDSGVPNRGVVTEATWGAVGEFFDDIVHPVASFQRRHFRILAANADFTMYVRC